jgi:tRNA-splicing ligase RtcB
MFYVRNWASVLEDNTREQLVVTARSPAPCGPVCAMPDAHLGRGSTVGSVIVTRDRIMPAAVGVDIGCGMIAVQTAFRKRDLPADLAPLWQEINRSIPAGAGQNRSKPHPDALEWLAENPVPERYGEDLRFYERITTQLGTLGSGNHFVEVCLDQRASVWVVLHSGSRAIGMDIANRYIKRAQEECQDVPLEDQDLAYLTMGSESFDGYMGEMLWAQGYALQNREVMMNLVLKDLVNFASGYEVPGPHQDFERQRINCHHNFTALEVHDVGHGPEGLWATRKGAIRAREGDLGIIPGSMATCTYIVEGRGNPDSYNSSSHGAGRVMSRGQARRELTEESLAEMMKGKAWNQRDAGDLVDEHPSAYKDIDQVMRDQEDLVEVREELVQVLNYKGADSQRRRKRKS